jgi:hypothetical protein
MTDLAGILICAIFFAAGYVYGYGSAKEPHP